MKDFKKMVKMADGGSVTDKFKQGVIDRLKERFPDTESQKSDKRSFENSAQRGLRELRTGSGSAAGEIPGTGIGATRTNKPVYKTGGKAKKKK